MGVIIRHINSSKFTRENVEKSHTNKVRLNSKLLNGEVCIVVDKGALLLFLELALSTAFQFRDQILEAAPDGRIVGL